MAVETPQRFPCDQVPIRVTAGCFYCNRRPSQGSLELHRPFNGSALQNNHAAQQGWLGVEQSNVTCIIPTERGMDVRQIVGGETPNDFRTVAPERPCGRCEFVRDMMDRETRSRTMSRIRAKNSGPELLLRRAMYRRRFRYRLHDKGLPGTPDLVFRKYHAVCFVHGCFWHRHPGCRFATTPTSHAQYWKTKLEGNAVRDRNNRQKLLELGWRVAIVWECALRDARGEDTATDLDRWLRGTIPEHETRLFFSR